MADHNEVFAVLDDIRNSYTEEELGKLIALLQMYVPNRTTEQDNVLKLLILFNNVRIRLGDMKDLAAVLGTLRKIRDMDDDAIKGSEQALTRIAKDILPGS